MSMDGLSLSALVAELQGTIVGGRIDKVFQPDKQSIVIWLRHHNENMRLIISADPSRPRFHLTGDVPENPSSPPVFCMLLRKHLTDGRISGIRQHGIDRVIILSIDIRGENGLIVTKELIVELMGKYSNIVLVSNNMIIDSVTRVGKNISRVREVLPGRQYFYPPEQLGFNILDSDPENIVESIKNLSQGLLVKAVVAQTTGLGPLTAKEIVWRAGLDDKLDISSLDSLDLGALADSISDIACQFSSNTLCPTVVTDKNGNSIAIAAFNLYHLEQYITHNFSSMSESIAYYYQAKGKQLTPARVNLAKLVTSEINRLLRKQTMLTEELSDAGKAEEIRQIADNIMANLHLINSADSQIELPNIYSSQSEDAIIAVALQPHLSPVQNAQVYYAKYNKLKRAQVLVAEQLEQCSEDIAYLESILVALETTAVSSADVNEIQQELIDAGYIKATIKKQAAKPSLAVPLIITTDTGASIIIGKNNKQNDVVTKQAQADDLWFHTKNIPGSHVILRSSQSNDSDIKLAAHLAAYFSKARSSANVPVDYTLRRHVKKPNGAKPGFVIYTNQQTVYVTPDEQTIKSILTSAK